jgi:hypothetical protein
MSFALSVALMKDLGDIMNKGHRCKYCGKRKPKSLMCKSKKVDSYTHRYCKTCYRLYIKHFSSGGHARWVERKRLCLEPQLKTEQCKRAIINMVNNYPHIFKEFRRFIRWTSGYVKGKEYPLTETERRYWYQRGMRMIKMYIEVYEGKRF